MWGLHRAAAAPTAEGTADAMHLPADGARLTQGHGALGSISPLTDYSVDANRCETILAWPDQRVWSEMGRLATPDGGTNLIGLACTLCKVRMGGQDREAYRLRIARAARLRGDLGHQAPPQLDRPRVLAQFSRQTVDASWRHIDSSPA